MTYSVVWSGATGANYTNFPLASVSGDGPLDLTVPVISGLTTEAVLLTLVSTHTKTDSGYSAVGPWYPTWIPPTGPSIYPIGTDLTPAYDSTTDYWIDAEAATLDPTGFAPSGTVDLRPGGTLRFAFGGWTLIGGPAPTQFDVNVSCSALIVDDLSPPVTGPRPTGFAAHDFPYYLMSRSSDVTGTSSSYSDTFTTPNFGDSWDIANQPIFAGLGAAGVASVTPAAGWALVAGTTHDETSSNMAHSVSTQFLAAPSTGPGDTMTASATLSAAEIWRDYAVIVRFWRLATRARAWCAVVGL